MNYHNKSTFGYKVWNKLYTKYEEKNTNTVYHSIAIKKKHLHATLFTQYCNTIKTPVSTDELVMM